MTHRFVCLTASAMMTASLAHAADPGEAYGVGRPVANFRLRDYRGAERSLDEWRDARVVVVAFLGVECPLVQLYAARLSELEQRYRERGVVVIGINANEQDAATEIGHFARAHGVAFPILKDVGNVVADVFGAERTPEVFVLDQNRVTRYRGRIDDQYDVGAQRNQPTRLFLSEALDDVLASRPVRAPFVPAVGCLIGRVRQPKPNATVNYAVHIAPILHRRCVACHRPGQIAPFSLLDPKEVVGWSAMIQEVVEQRRMPPWHAAAAAGVFANDTSLSSEETAAINAWVEGGAPLGDLSKTPAPPTFEDGWRIGSPDAIVSLPEPFHVPAEGVIDYQYTTVDPGFTEDRWIQAADVLPSNPSVVHHVLVFLCSPYDDELVLQGDLGSVYLASFAPGSPPLRLPAGMAKRVPARWRFRFQMHYTTTGKPEVDQTRLALKFADPATVRAEVATNMALDMTLSIPPRTSEHPVRATRVFADDVLLWSMAPHMHVRGKTFRYTARYPDGSEETLLDIPRYDFNWQNTYVLREPKLLPRGTAMICDATFDNSTRNPANPDPDKTVTWGLQSWEEMMIGYFDVSFANQDRTKPVAEMVRVLEQRLARPATLFSLAGLLGLTWLTLMWLGLSARRRRERTASTGPTTPASTEK